MQRFALLLLSLAASPVAASVQQSVLEANANPIRKVVNMLQAMQKKVTEEGEKEKELYDKFMCYCKGSGGELSSTISAAETKVPALGSDIEAAEGKLAQLKEELKQAQVDRSAAKQAMAEATAIREKEAAAYAAEKAEYDANIAALTKAVAALEKGMAGAFLQTNDAQVLRKLAVGKSDILDVDRQELVAFLSNSADYAPQSGEITGILKTMLDSMKKSLAEATDAEKAAITSYEELMAAKGKEVAALTKAVETKTTRIGELGVQIVQMKEDLSDTEAQLIQDQKFIADLEKNCATKTAEWEERQKTRSEELVALAETIKVLNDDDALDLFKKTLPGAGSASLLQVRAGAKNMRTQALASIQKAMQLGDKRDKAGLDLIVLALSGRKALSKGGFDKVIKMIDNLVALLKTEQLDDEHKKEHCEKQFDIAEDKEKELGHLIIDEETAMENAVAAIATLEEEITTTSACIVQTDKDVTEQTEQRKEENEEYSELMASNGAAKQLLEFAKNRLNKFYNPKLYKAPPKRQLSEEERITVNMGGTLAPEGPAGGIAGTGIGAAASFVQIRAHTQVKGAGAPPPPPETFGAYTKKSEESGGVIAMIDLLVKDLDKEMQEAEVMEKDSQAEYEKMMEESATKRASDSKSITEKENLKATTEGELDAEKDKKAATTKDLLATADYMSSLHEECDWLLSNFDARKAARTSEIEALGNAKAVLSGADFSLLQTASRGFMAKRQ